MLRLTGAVLLLAAGIWLGLSVRNTERKRAAVLAFSVVLVRHARRKIDLFETPVPELFTDFSSGFDEKLDKALCEQPLIQALEPVVSELGADGDVLIKFAKELGCGYREDALRLCDYCTEILEDKHTAAVQRYGMHKKLYLTLPLLLAVSIIVLLL